MLVTPGAHDQPDNAARLMRLGVSRTVPRGRYYAPRVANELRELLTDLNYEERAREFASIIAQEDRIAVACEGIENVLALQSLRN